jgi:hypothetical protein
LVKVDRKYSEQRPVCTPVSFGQPDMGDDLPVPPRSPQYVRGLPRVLTDSQQ